KEGAETTRPIGPHSFEQATVAKALEEDILDGIVEFPEQFRAPPPHRQVCPDHRRVADRKGRPRFLASRCCIPEQGPAAGSSIPPAPTISSGYLSSGFRMAAGVNGFWFLFVARHCVAVFCLAEDRHTVADYAGRRDSSLHAPTPQIRAKSP